MGESGGRVRDRWNDIVCTWEVLRFRALQLPNEADKTFVLSNLGTEVYPLVPGMEKALLGDAETSISNLSNHIDRPDRIYIVAESYKKISDNDAATFLLNEAMKCASLCSREEGQDQIFGSIIETAHCPKS